MIRTALVSALSLGLAGCWQSMSSHIPASAIALVDGRIVFVATDYVERVNTHNFPETRAPQLVSVKHRVLVFPEAMAEGSSAAPHAGAVEFFSVEPGDQRPYLLVEQGVASVWDKALLKAHLLREARVKCQQGEWFDRGPLSAPLFYVCSDDTAYRFDDSSGKQCRLSLRALASLSRFSPLESPVERIFAQRGQSIVLVEADGRFFRIDSCETGEVSEIDPFSSLPSADRPVPLPQGQISPPPYTQLSDFSADTFLFVTGSIRDKPDTVLVVGPDKQVQRISLPAALRDAPLGAAGPWLNETGDRVLWQAESPDPGGGAIFHVLDLRSKQFFAVAVPEQPR